MTTEKNVGKFETLMLRILTLIVMIYLASAQEFVSITVPIEVSIIFIGAVVGYFLNRFVLKLEDYANAHILAIRMRAELEKQRQEYEIAAHMEKTISSEPEVSLDG